MTYANSRKIARNPSIQGWLKSKPTFLLLLVLLCVHRSCSTVSNIVWSNVRSLTVERRIRNYELFTLHMKAGHQCTNKSITDWCTALNGHFDTQSSCSCSCRINQRYTFIPFMQSCINKTLAAKFGDCSRYFGQGNLLAYPNDPVNVITTTIRAFPVSSAKSCILSQNYFIHDYNGFQKRWITASDGFFSLSMSTITSSFYIKWQPVSTVPETLNGRIVRLVVTCSKSSSSSSSSGCVLLKVGGTVTYFAPEMSSKISATSSFVNGASSSYLLLSSSSSSLVVPPVLTSSSFSVMLPATSALLPSPSVPKASNAGMSLPPRVTQSQTTRLSAFTKLNGEVQSTSKTKLQSLSSKVTSKKPHLLSSMAVHPVAPLETTSMVSASSTAVIVKPGGRETQTGGNDNGVVIGAAVGGAVVLGAVVVIIFVFWKRRRAEKRPETEPRQVKNPVYGTSTNEIPLERSKGSQIMPSSVQDNQELYQDLIISNENSNGIAIYSNPEDDYDNCKVYQSLEKEKPGSPVYQSLSTSQGKAAHTTGLPKNSTRTSVSGPLNSKAKLATGMPKAKPDATGNPYQKPIVNSKPVYHALEGQDGEEDYEASNVDSLYNVLEGPDATYESSEKVLEDSVAESDPVYNVLEEAETHQKPPESGPSAAQEPLYNVLDDSDAGKDLLIQQSSSDPQDEPVYNVLEESDSGAGPSKPHPLSGHDNPAYEQTLQFEEPYAAVHKPGSQRESLYEPLREPSQDLYAPYG